MLFTRDMILKNPNLEKYTGKTCVGCTCYDCAKWKTRCKLSFNNCDICSFHNNYHIYICSDKESNKGNPYRN